MRHDFEQPQRHVHYTESVRRSDVHRIDDHHSVRRDDVDIAKLGRDEVTGTDLDAARRTHPNSYVEAEGGPHPHHIRVYQVTPGDGRHGDHFPAHQHPAADGSTLPGGPTFDIPPLREAGPNQSAGRGHQAMAGPMPDVPFFDPVDPSQFGDQQV
jgi:hypothetical protein